VSGGLRVFGLRDRMKDEWDCHDLNCARALALTSSHGIPASG
jgi:hypothetical protein